jgi:hypothetical protein
MKTISNKLTVQLNRISMFCLIIAIHVILHENVFEIFGRRPVSYGPDHDESGEW